MNAEKFLSVYRESRNGCDHYVRHPMVRKFLYTSGVQELADEGVAWLVDALAFELPMIFMNNPDEVIGLVHVNVNSKAKCRIVLTFHDGQEKSPPWVKNIEYTDMPEGDYVFEVGVNHDSLILSLLSEH